MRSSCIKKHFFEFIPCNLDDTIIQSSLPRSGSTWLAEIICTLPDYKSIGEPFKATTYREAREAGFERPNHLVPYLRPGSEAGGKKQYIQRVLEGRVPGGWRFMDGGDTSLFSKVSGHLTHRKIFIKSINSNLILQWISDKYPVRAAILLIRHPCAVVASMKEFGKWSHATPDPNSPSQEDVLASLPPYIVDSVRDRLPKSIETKEEVLALRWALDYHIPFYTHREFGYPWILVPYERLVAARKEEVARIFEFLGERPPAEAYARLERSSNSSTGTTNPKDQWQQLSKWKRRLNEDEIRSILRISDAFDLDFYSRAVEPDYSRMSTLQNESAPKMH